MNLIEEFTNNNKKVIDAYLDRLMELLYRTPRCKYKHDRKWSRMNKVPETEGVYGIFDAKGVLCYVGETACLQARMDDIYDTMHHTIRRNIAKLDFKYNDVSSTKKADYETEEKINNQMEQFKLSWIEVKLGRCELEEHIIGLKKPRYNTKTKRILKRKNNM